MKVEDGQTASLFWETESWCCFQRAVETARAKHFSDIIAANAHNPLVLYNTLTLLLMPMSLWKLTENSDNFVNTGACISLASHHRSILLTCLAVFDHLELISLSSLEKLVTSMKPTVMSFLHIFLRLLLLLVFLSLMSLMVIWPPAILNMLWCNPCWRNLTLTLLLCLTLAFFPPKILGKIVYTQLKAFLDECKILEEFHFGFKTNHSTESALLRVFNNIFLAMFSGNRVFLVF